MKILEKILLIAVSSASLTSCATQISPDTYATRQVGEVSTTLAGVIQNVRQVYVQEKDRLQDNEMGVIGGGATGGILGGVLGRGHLLPVAAGVVAGAVTGSLIENKAKKQVAYEYVVQLQTGELVTIVQGPPSVLAIGQPVYVIMSPNGRSRITPQY